MFGHKTANSWNLLITVATRKYRSSLLKPATEANCSFRTIEVERLKAYDLFIVSLSCYRSSSRSGVPIGSVVLTIVAACAFRAEEASLISESTGEIILSLEFSEELKELLPDEAGK
ncbi:hypothetical protein Tco_0836404 [Tanacetum coccineum]